MMIDIAEHCGVGFVPIKDVSRRQAVSVKYLEQIVSQLTKAGLLRSGRGSQGGYTLVKTPREYTVGEILRVAEGTLAPVACLADPDFGCNRVDFCPTIAFWRGLHDAIDKYVDSATLQSLIKNKPGGKKGK
jgi:Rrf2 family protein